MIDIERGVEKYKAKFGDEFKKKTIRLALQLLKDSSDSYSEPYTTKGFEPHDWVVVAMCEAIQNRKFWKAINDI